MELGKSNIYFRPVNPHQYFPAQIHGEEEQVSGIAGVQRLVSYYTDVNSRLMLMVVFKHPTEFNPDRICGYQAVIENSDSGTVARPDLNAVGEACEEYWGGILGKVFGGDRRDSGNPRYTGRGEEAKPSGHAG